MSKTFGNACSALLGVAILTRAAVPWLPAGPWSPSGYQCGSYYLFLPLGRTHSCTAEAAFGEEARVTNRLEFSTFRRERFTVDEHGYRNDSLNEAGKPRVILFGSSFSLGLSLSDEDTLSAQLTRRLGYTVYNASDVLNPVLSAGPLTRAAKAINMEKGWVLLELLDRAPYYWAQTSAPTFRQRLKQQARDTLAPLQSVERRMRNPYVVTRVSTMLNKHFENNVVLPNASTPFAPEEVLTNSRHMLFYIEDEKFFEKPADPRLTVNAVVRLREDLAREGLKLAVMLMPSGYTVYYPMFREGSGADGGGVYMEVLREQLNGAGVHVYNCLPVLREEAARELAQNRLIFWPDDAHWNPRGVAAVANALTPWLRSLTDAVQ
ncbi:MAG TPA: hypothetical protein VG273_12590 [Bryobacteraceae bacterium]|nr:hypothetical protein [Bryobacteraceae bacterium]